ncbi:MAG: hypothetical protein WCX71_01010 [Candidatus Buchananbacteria bacterium]
MIDIKRIIVQEILIRAMALKDKYTNEREATAAWICIFSQNDKEYQELLTEAQKLGDVFETDLSGTKLLLDEPPMGSNARILKIRKPDPKKPEKGDVDFTVSNYANFKKEYQNKKNFKLIQRDSFEMLELTEPGATVRAYFSNPPIEEQYQDLLKK